MLTETKIIAALADPARNLFGQHGPRCYWCSGMGYMLKAPAVPHWMPPTKATSRCACGGSGLDHESLRRDEFQSVVEKLARMEKDNIRLARRIRDLEQPGTSNIGHRRVRNSRQYWSELIAWATADGTAVANTTTEAIVFPNVTIPANYMQDGRALTLVASGRWSNVVTAVPTLTFALRWGGVAGTIFCQSGAITTPATATTNAIWRLQVEIQTRSNGATGTLFAIGHVTLFEDAAPVFGTVTNYGVDSPMGSAGVATPAAVTLDLSADTALSLTADWSAANGSNTMTGHIYLLKSEN